MIIKHIFKLDNYYKTTKRYYYFFDGMFKLKNESKMDVLKSLNLPSSTYRLNRNSDVIKNKNHLPLLKYFGISSKLYKQEDIEVLLSKAYSVLYYKQEEEYAILQSSIEKCINKNTYMNPIFILFKVLFLIITNREIRNILDLIKEDVIYLTNFPEEYFDDEFKVINAIIMHFSGIYQHGLKSRMLNSNYPYLSWLYYHLCGSTYFYKKEYSNAIIFYDNALSLYKADLNIKRQLECQMNIGAMYNYLGEYSIAIRNLEPLVEHSIFQTDNFPLKCYSIMHYVIALMETHQYNFILRVIRSIDIKYVNDITSMVGIISSFKEKVKKEEVLETLKTKTEQSKDIKIVYEYLYDSVPLPKAFIDDNSYYYMKLIKNKLEIC